jgi:hypothetical protein
MPSARTRLGSSSGRRGAQPRARDLAASLRVKLGSLEVDADIVILVENWRLISPIGPTHSVC